jgi:anaerobic selenocysteine-containing dehydrogenase
MSITRRSFLKGSAATAALSVVGGSAINVLGAETAALANGPGNKWPGRVVVNFNKSAVTGTTTVNEAVVKQMVDDSIKLLTDQATVGAAWKAVFPSTLSATSKIAIKINILNNGTTRWQRCS